MLREALIFTYHVTLIIIIFFPQENPQQGHDLTVNVRKIEQKFWTMSIRHCPTADFYCLKEHSWSIQWLSQCFPWGMAMAKPSPFATLNHGVLHEREIFAIWETVKWSIHAELTDAWRKQIIKVVFLLPNHKSKWDNPCSCSRYLYADVTISLGVKTKNLE